MKIDIELEGLEETQAEADRIARELGGSKFLQGMRQATLLVDRDAKRRAPVDTGRLRASITPEVRSGGTIQGVVGTNVKYAVFQEFGTVRHFVPAQYIGRWASRHGFDYGGLVVSGKKQPFLYPAFEENQARIVDILGRTVEGIVK